ncbi:TetR/AcrR family transcriptional regulator C-terminal domain-containing protein [Actinomadura sp. ATCC 31491]|uniref:TetR/AcrR family transcriptional regulator C-terminal domain-containing protein n=1 Tax=Actinomadura luzonensis TaxID=2805427 RepID=A0ABT0G193_9ACTN|nr:TetR/AcrR family transcriptional regulator C-terminal domain-containing protein [Actinomadura luzonensis]MCK2218375.1 TetR/AcrR family transcriptional regulator C-terminal domain-containing protein [Actinomadura luzonensis]
MALDKQRIVAEAVALLDAEGLDGVTTRKLAARLGVRSPTLYWHIPNKAALVTAIAEAILEQQFPELTSPPPEERWQDWLIGLAGRLRHALLAHPDGARIIAASQLSLKMAAISELAMSTLVGRDIPLRRARLIVLTVLRFTVGYVLEEQAGRPDADALDGFDLAAYATAYPTVMAGVTEYFEAGRTVDDLFRDCLEQIVHG